MATQQQSLLVTALEAQLNQEQQDHALATNALQTATAMPDTTPSLLSAKEAAIFSARTKLREATVSVGGTLNALAQARAVYTPPPTVTPGPTPAPGATPSHSNGFSSAAAKLPPYKDPLQPTKTVDDPIEWLSKVDRDLAVGSPDRQLWYPAIAARVPTPLADWLKSVIKPNWHLIVDDATYDQYFQAPFIAKEVSPSYQRECQNNLNSLSQRHFSIRSYNDYTNYLMKVTHTVQSSPSALAAYIHGLRLDLQTKLLDHDVNFKNARFTTVAEAQEYALEMDPMDRGDREPMYGKQAKSGKSTAPEVPPPATTGNTKTSRNEPYKKAAEVKGSPGIHVTKEPNYCRTCAAAGKPNVLFSFAHLQSVHGKMPAMGRSNTAPLPSTGHMNNMMVEEFHDTIADDEFEAYMEAYNEQDDVLNTLTHELVRSCEVVKRLMASCCLYTSGYAFVIECATSSTMW